MPVRRCATVTRGHRRTGPAEGATWGGLLVFTVILVFMVWVFRRVLRQVGRDPAELEGIAERIAGGDLADQEGQSRQPATGVYAALIRMRSRLSTQLEEIENAARENGRMRSALDNATSAITVSDQDDKVIYLNTAARSFLPAWRRRCGAGTRTLMRRGWSAAALPIISAIRSCAMPTPPDSSGTDLRNRLRRSQPGAGGESVYSDDGEYLGRITEWRDITGELAQRTEDERRIAEERRVAQENQRIRRGTRQCLVERDGCRSRVSRHLPQPRGRRTFPHCRNRHPQGFAGL